MPSPSHLVILTIIALIALAIMPVLNLVSSDMSLSDAITVLQQNGYVAFASPVGDLSVTGDLDVTGDIEGTTGRAATLTVAFSDTPTTAKNQADYLVSGTADDEINAAITALAVTGGEVYIHAGSGTITNSLSIASPNIKLNGAGDATHITAVSMAGDYMIDIDDNANGTEICNMWLDLGQTADYGVRFVNTNMVNSVDIHNLKVSHGAVGSALIGIANVDNIIVADCMLQGNSSLANSSLGMNILDNTLNCSISGIIGDDLQETGISVGTDTANTIDRISVSNCIFNGGTGRGVDFYGSVTNSGVYNCIIKGKNDGVVVQKSSPVGYYPQNIEVVGNTIINPSLCGLKFYQCGNTTVTATDNTIVVTSAGAHAIECEGSGADALYALLLESNSVNMERQNTYAGIYIGDGTVTGTLKIDDNYIYGGAIGVWVRTISCGGTINDNTFIMADYQGCLLEGCNNFTIGDNTAINNNQGEHANVTQGSGIALVNRSNVGCTDITVSDNIAYDDRATKLQKWGFSETGNSDYNIFTNNIGRNNASGNVTTVGIHTIVDNNL